MNPIEDGLREVLEATAAIDKDMESLSLRGARIASSTTWIIRGVVVMIVVSVFYMLYLTLQLREGMVSLAEDMVQMYSQFGTMTQHVNGITASVIEMGGHTSNIPPIAEDMKTMSHNVGGMRTSVENMDNAVAKMDTDMYQVTTNVHEMSVRFGQMTGSVQGMGWNVNQMRQPTDILPPFMGR